MLIFSFSVFNDTFFLTTQIKKPFFVIELPNDEFALELAARCASIRSVIEHWASASACDLFHSQLKAYIASHQKDAHFIELYNSSFRITVETFNKRIQQKEKVDKIETLAYLPFNGDINLKNPNIEYFYIEYYEHNPMNLPIQPEHYYFGKWVSFRTKNRFFNFNFNFLMIEYELNFSWAMDCVHKLVKFH